MGRYEPLFPLEEHFQKVLTYKGYSIYDVDHSVVRYNERIGKDIEVYNSLLKKGIDWLIDNKKTMTEDRYLWYSKPEGFGIQIHWRPDRKTKKYGGFSATTLSNDELKILTKNDKKIFLESLWKAGYSKEESMKIVERGYMRYRFNEDLEKEMNFIGYDMFVDGGPDVYLNFELITL